MDLPVKNVEEYRKLVEHRIIPKVYRGLMAYMKELNTHLGNKYPEFVPGNFYQGYMDITYFTLTPRPLKNKRLKVIILFSHNDFRFEVGLAGQNKQIQLECWQIFVDNKWNKYVVPDTSKDYVTYDILVDNPDFSNMELLTHKLEKGVADFVKYVSTVLTKK